MESNPGLSSAFLEDDPIIEFILHYFLWNLRLRRNSQDDFGVSWETTDDFLHICMIVSQKEFHSESTVELASDK